MWSKCVEKLSYFLKIVKNPKLVSREKFNNRMILATKTSRSVLQSKISCGHNLCACFNSRGMLENKNKNYQINFFETFIFNVIKNKYFLDQMTGHFLF